VTVVPLLSVDVMWNWSMSRRTPGSPMPNLARRVPVPQRELDVRDPRPLVDRDDLDAPRARGLDRPENDSPREA